MLRRVKLFVANSLDNFIARADGGVDWLAQDGDYGMRAFFKSVDPALLGAGLPLFPGEYPQTDLKLLKCETYETGLVQLVYALK